MFATEIRWYRSRSKTTEGTWVHGPRTRYSQSLRKYLSIFQAEIHVTEKCIHFNQAIKALSSYAINSKMVWGCVEKLSGLSEENTVTLTWTPGHNGVTGNEIADSFERLTGILTRHWRIKGNLNKRRFEEDTKCIFCDESETSIRILTESRGTIPKRKGRSTKFRMNYYIFNFHA